MNINEYNMSIKARTLSDIKKDIIKTNKELSDFELNLLSENIYEIALLLNKGIMWEEINVYIVYKNLANAYDDNLKTRDFNFNLELELLHDLIVKYTERIKARI